MPVTPKDPFILPLYPFGLSTSIHRVSPSAANEISAGGLEVETISEIKDTIFLLPQRTWENRVACFLWEMCAVLNVPNQQQTNMFSFSRPRNRTSGINTGLLFTGFALDKVLGFAGSGPLPHDDVTPISAGPMILTVRSSEHQTLGSFST